MTNHRRAIRTVYVIALTLVMLGLIGFAYHYDETSDYASRTAAEPAGQA